MEGGGGHCLFEGGYPTAKLPPLLSGDVCPSVFFLPPQNQTCPIAKITYKSDSKSSTQLSVPIIPCIS